VILTSAVLITLSLYRLGQEDPGFDPNDVLVVSMDLNFTNYSNADQAREFGRRLLQEVESLPEVQVAALSGETPLESGLVGVRAFEIEGRALSDPDLRPNMSIRQTSADYHALLGIPLLAGRTLAAGDDELAERVVVINRAFEREHFPDGAAVGERISDDGGNSWWRIVGVTGDIRARSLEEVEGPTAYVDFRQLPITGIDLFVRSAADLERLGDEIVDRVHAMDSQQAVDRVRTMEEIRSQSLATPRLIATLVGLFGVLALLVTLSGVIGVVSWNVAQRIREVGVRIAVGANPDHVIRMFLVQGLRIHIFGLLLGLCLMVALASLLGNFLYGGEALDTAVYLSVVLVMTVTAVAAMYVPARRAGQLDPNAALASE
jgi:predicted permease